MDSREDVNINRLTDIDELSCDQERELLDYITLDRSKDRKTVWISLNSGSYSFGYNYTR